MGRPTPTSVAQHANVERAETRNGASALLDANGASALLSVPATWLLAEARADRVPHVRLGRYVRFDPDDLLAWVATRARGPKPRRTGSQPVSNGRGGQ